MTPAAQGPRTAAGRALLRIAGRAIYECGLTDADILAIEAEAANAIYDELKGSDYAGEAAAGLAFDDPGVMSANPDSTVTITPTPAEAAATTQQGSRTAADALAAALTDVMVPVPWPHHRGQQAERILAALEAAGWRLEAAVPAQQGALRAAIEYAANAAHHQWWDNDNQGGHTDSDWRKCPEWPCAALAGVGVPQQQPGNADVGADLQAAIDDAADYPDTPAAPEQPPADTHGHTGNGTFCQVCVNAGASIPLDVERLARADLAVHKARHTDCTDTVAMYRGHAELVAAAYVAAQPSPSIESVMGNGDGTMKAWLSDGTTRTITEAEYLAWPRAAQPSPNGEKTP